MSVRRKLGEGTTGAELKLEEALRRMARWPSDAITYHQLVGGITNENWLVEVRGDDRKYFVKIPGDGTEMFIDRNIANEAACAAFEVGVGPEVIYFDPVTGVEACEFLEDYRSCTNADFEDAGIQHEVLSIYRTLNDGKPLQQTKTVFDMVDEHLDQARSLNCLFPADMPWMEHRYNNAKSAFQASGLDIVPCFNDPFPANFLIPRESGSEKPMKLIDFEYASNNERSYELGVLFGEMFFDDQLAESLVEYYYGSMRRDMLARVMVCKALADVKWGAFAIVNRKVKSWDFDYQKYGSWKFMRARHVMLDARWDDWLRLI